MTVCRGYSGRHACHHRGWNPAAARLYGWEAAEALGKTLSEVLATKLLTGQSLEDALPQMAAEERWQGELEQQGRGGAKLLVSAAVTVEWGADGEWPT